MNEIPMVDLAAQRIALGDSLTRAIDRVLDHGRFILGPEVDELESELAAYTGANHVVTCANGTDALVLALRALHVRPGDQVVVPAFTFAATAEAVALVGAQPVFADISSRSFTIDPASMEAELPQLSRRDGQPVGIIAVDLFGHPADYDGVSNLARRYDCWVLSDAAQSLGSRYLERRSGSLVPVTATSFFPSKPLGCIGDGGAIFCADDEFAAELQSLRNHGAGSDRYEHVRVGYNSRLDTVQAAVLLEKLRVFDDELKQRDAIADRYTRAFASSGVQTPSVARSVVSAWAQYTVRLRDRDRVASDLAGQGIATAVHYPTALADQRAYQGYPTLGSLPVARRVCHEVLSLPIHPYLGQDDQDRVIEAVLRAVRPPGRVT